MDIHFPFIAFKSFELQTNNFIENIIKNNPNMTQAMNEEL